MASDLRSGMACSSKEFIQFRRFQFVYLFCRNESNTSTGFSRDPLVPASRRGGSDYIFA
jgi:hypothetical protein